MGCEILALTFLDVKGIFALRILRRKSWETTLLPIAPVSSSNLPVRAGASSLISTLFRFLGS